MPRFSFILNVLPSCEFIQNFFEHSKLLLMSLLSLKGNGNVFMIVGNDRPHVALWLFLSTLRILPLHRHYSERYFSLSYVHTARGHRQGIFWLLFWMVRFLVEFSFFQEGNKLAVPMLDLQVTDKEEQKSIDSGKWRLLFNRKPFQNAWTGGKELFGKPLIWIGVAVWLVLLDYSHLLLLFFEDHNTINLVFRTLLLIGIIKLQLILLILRQSFKI